MVHHNDTTYILIAILVASLFALLGTVVQRHTPGIKHLHLPGSLMGGVLALLVGPQILGEYAPHWLPSSLSFLHGGLLPERLLYAWKELPEAFINVVFAGLLLGKTMPAMKTIFSKAGPQVVMGHCLAWSQYVVGIGLTLWLLVPYYDVSPLNGAMIAIGFQGGYGTAVGLGETFAELGYVDGMEVGVGMATIGKIVGLLFGPLLLFYAIRMELVDGADPHEEVADHKIPRQEANEEYREKRKESSQLTDALMLHIAAIAAAITVGWILLYLLRYIEVMLLGADSDIAFMRYVPLFPMAMIGGLIIQVILSRLGKEDWISRRLIARISGTALDIVIMTAIATIALDVVANHIEVLLILAIGGLISNLVVFFILGPRFYKKDPWVYGIGDLGHSTGTTATGLMLMRAADPHNEAGAKEAYNYKQSLYEPILGGGIITALAVPLIHSFGLQNMLYATGGLFVFWTAFGLVAFGHKKSGELIK